jgi:hypothetical protein
MLASIELTAVINLLPLSPVIVNQRIKPPTNQSSAGVELECRDESNLAKSGTTSSAKNPSDACTSSLFFPPACRPARI